MTPLGARLAAEIATTGPITLDRYMAACLGDPQHGYYMRREPFGTAGDFVTAPEVSQMFGELIGAWAMLVHEAMGSPSPFVLAELGPGRGTLMADLLRAARLRPEFRDAARVVLVETSPRLRAAQEKRLAASGARIAWADSVEAIPGGPLIVVANEFFDALPVRQFVRTSKGWAERMVGLDGDGALAWGLRPVPAAAIEGIAPEDLAAAAAVDADTIEVSPAATAVMEVLAGRIAGDGGAGLVIDYGHGGPAFGDTLQAVRGHRPADPLEAPGEADLTAHVDFGALARAATTAGCAVRPLIAQGEFLLRLGLAERAAILAAGKDDATRASIAAAVERLSGAEAMGRLFRVLAFASPGLALPGFDPA